MTLVGRLLVWLIRCLVRLCRVLTDGLKVVGGIHGENRLGGNALTEALVFGRVAAKSIVAQLGARQQRQALPVEGE